MGAVEIVVNGEMPNEFERTAPFLQQPIFNSIWSETEMMRYMHALQLKDLALDKSMISLGSCTMKLNSVASLAPCSWPEVMNVHPFEPDRFRRVFSAANKRCCRGVRRLVGHQEILGEQ